MQQIAQVGPWEFDFPDGWVSKSNESSASYFENLEGSKGLYVKDIQVQEPYETSLQLSQYIQEVHERGFTETTTNDWEIVDARSKSDFHLTRSALDLIDTKANYRVLSLVVCDHRTAIQLTFHDYWCSDYEATRSAFNEIENSIAQVPSAA
ncbi:hypothetical protein [Roseateles sp.]|uniref:hypothetical protein n=1 Tax=Roseateles sp. TaxID=1971397 RepID=UPI00326782C5